MIKKPTEKEWVEFDLKNPPKFDVEDIDIELDLVDCYTVEEMVRVLDARTQRLKTRTAT
jgi:hypothetical protein